MLDTTTIYSVALVSFCSFSFGISLTSFECLNNPRKEATQVEGLFFNNGIPLSDTQWSILISVICIGALFSSLLHSYVQVNMKIKLIINNLLYITGTFLILILSNFVTVLLGRFLIEVAIGTVCCIVPSYLHSISPPKARGTIGTFHQLAVVVGVFFGQLLTYFYNQTNTWHMVYYIILVYLALQTSLLFFIKDVYDDANIINVGFVELFKYKQAYRSLVTAAVLHSSQQFSCFNGVISYSTQILEDKSNPDLYAIYLGAISIFSTTASLFFIDRFGRKKLLLSSLGLVIAGLVMLAFDLKKLMALFIYISGFNFGLGPITWILGGEIFPGQFTDAGVRYGVSINWISNAMVLLIFPVLNTMLANYSFLFFGFFCIGAYVYLLVYFKETKNRQPEFQ